MDVPAHEALCKSTEGAVCTHTAPRFHAPTAYNGVRGQKPGPSPKRGPVPLQREPQRGEATSNARASKHSDASNPDRESNQPITQPHESTAPQCPDLLFGDDVCDSLAGRARARVRTVSHFGDTIACLRERGSGDGRMDRGSGLRCERDSFDGLPLRRPCVPGRPPRPRATALSTAVRS